MPAYSHMPRGQGAEKRALLSVLLSVRNIDPAAVVTLTHVDYFDTSGHSVRRYLDEPRALRPLETAEYWVDTNDDAGGSGANEAAGQVQVSVETALAALPAPEWTVVVAEDRPRTSLSGVDAVIRAVRNP